MTQPVKVENTVMEEFVWINVQQFYAQRTKYVLMDNVFLKNQQIYN